MSCPFFEQSISSSSFQKSNNSLTSLRNTFRHLPVAQLQFIDNTTQPNFNFRNSNLKNYCCFLELFFAFIKTAKRHSNSGIVYALKYNNNYSILVSFQTLKYFFRKSKKNNCKKGREVDLTTWQTTIKFKLYLYCLYNFILHLHSWFWSTHNFILCF